MATPINAAPASCIKSKLMHKFPDIHLQHSDRTDKRTGHDSASGDRSAAGAILSGRADEGVGGLRDLVTEAGRGYGSGGICWSGGEDGCSGD